MNNDNLVGFRIICSLNKYKGIHSLSLGKSAEFYKKVEHFENVRLNSNGGWEGIECPLKTLPIQNLDGSYKTPPLKWFVLGKMYQDSNYVGLKLMDLNGDVFYKTLKECRELYDSDGFINVSVSDRDTMELDFIKGGIPTYPIKKKGSDRLQDNLKEYNIKENIPDRDYNITKDKNLTIVQKDIKKINKDVSSINKDHYIELATLFAKKEKGLVSDRDIADVVGARSPQEYSSKIKEYLGEPTTLSDSDVLKRLYRVYQQNVQKAEGDNVGMPMSVKGDKDIARMQELIDKLVPAAEAYYTGADEIMSNYEYDKLYNELEDLEKKTGIVLAGSLTQKVGFEVKSKLPKVKHATKMLSLDKTKDRQELANSLGGQEGFLGWKLDGCFAGHTKITMSDGSLKKIKDVLVGDEVLSYDFEKNELCKRKVINRFFNGYKLNSEWVKISTVSKSDCDPLIVTKNHLFYTPFGWKRADELNIGDIIYKNDSVLSENQISEGENGVIPIEIISYTELKDENSFLGEIIEYEAYDLEIEGTHAYFAKGCLVHNCTTVFTYENGELISAVTRGNGSIGEDITHNAKFFAGVPQKISYKDRLVVRGEALISRKNFDRINAQITNVDDKYKNARNLASGSIRQLDSKVAKERHVEVVAFTVVEGFDWIKTYTGKLEELRKYGFDIVPYIKVKPSEVIKGIEYFEDKVEKYKFPTDGLVITIDDIAYGEMLGNTAKFPRNSKAFKWKDEPEPTELIDIEWSVGRTGAITPVAIFKPVEIDGTTVQRASVHNVSIMKQLKLGKGDVVNIIKSNMVIPQVVENLTKSGTCVPPSVCPVCGGPTQIQISQQAEVLMCVNPNCVAKHIGNLSHFVERDAMNIDGLSEATLERFVNEGYIKTYRDIYHLSDYEKDIVKLDGFGRASYTKLIKAIDKSRECELPAFIYALGINQVGKRTAKDICQGLDYDLGVMLRISEDDLKKLPNIGDKTAYEFVNYMQIHGPMIIELTKELKFKAMQKINRNSPISGMTFCITGDVYQFKNRKELQALIESLGAKASSSVSAKTNYLINNDITSNSNKNQTAKKLGIPIISENDFLKMIGR